MSGKPMKTHPAAGCFARQYVYPIPKSCLSKLFF